VVEERRKLMNYQYNKALQHEQLDLKATYKAPFSVLLLQICPNMYDSDCEYVFKTIQKCTPKVKAEFCAVDQSATVRTSHYHQFDKFLAATSCHKSL